MDILNKSDMQVQIPVVIDGTATTLYLQPHGRTTVSEDTILDPNVTKNPFIVITKKVHVVVPKPVVAKVDSDTNENLVTVAQIAAKQALALKESTDIPNSAIL